MSWTRPFSVLAVAVVAIAACGGDDDEPATETPGADGTPADPATPPEASDQESQADDAASDVTGQEAPTDDSDTTQDAGQPVDDGTPAAPSADIDAAIAQLGDVSVGAGGGGVVSVAGIRFEFDADSCVAEPDEFRIEGVARGDDGTEAWVEASSELASREVYGALMDEAVLDSLFADGPFLEMFLEVRVGATESWQYPPDQPSWHTQVESPISFGRNLSDVESTADGLRGAGQAEDFNNFGDDRGELVPIAFSFACG